MTEQNNLVKLQRRCALIIGAFFLIIGIAGFVPGLVSLPPAGFQSPIPLDTPSTYAQGFGYLFGLFPTNLMHNLVHLTVGLLGITAASTQGGARFYNRAFAVSYILIALMGVLPLTQTTFGLMPIFGNNVWLNALTGIITAYVGFLAPPSAETPTLNT